MSNIIFSYIVAILSF